MQRPRAPFGPGRQPNGCGAFDPEVSSAAVGPIASAVMLRLLADTVILDREPMNLERVHLLVRRLSTWPLHVHEQVVVVPLHVAAVDVFEEAGERFFEPPSGGAPAKVE